MKRLVILSMVLLLASAAVAEDDPIKFKYKGKTYYKAGGRIFGVEQVHKDLTKWPEMKFNKERGEFYKPSAGITYSPSAENKFKDTSDLLPGQPLPVEGMDAEHLEFSAWQSIKGFFWALSQDEADNLQEVLGWGSSAANMLSLFDVELDAIGSASAIMYWKNIGELGYGAVFSDTSFGDNQCKIWRDDSPSSGVSGRGGRQAVYINGEFSEMEDHIIECAEDDVCARWENGDGDTHCVDGMCIYRSSDPEDPKPLMLNEYVYYMTLKVFPKGILAEEWQDDKKVRFSIEMFKDKVRYQQSDRRVNILNDSDDVDSDIIELGYDDPGLDVFPYVKIYPEKYKTVCIQFHGVGNCYANGVIEGSRPDCHYDLLFLKRLGDAGYKDRICNDLDAIESEKFKKKMSGYSFFTLSAGGSGGGDGDGGVGGGGGSSESSQQLNTNMYD